MSGTAGHADLAGSQELQEVAAAVVAVMTDPVAIQGPQTAWWCHGARIHWCAVLDSPIPDPRSRLCFVKSALHEAWLSHIR